MSILPKLPKGIARLVQAVAAPASQDAGKRKRVKYSELYEQARAREDRQTRSQRRLSPTDPRDGLILPW